MTGWSACQEAWSGTGWRLESASPAPSRPHPLSSPTQASPHPHGGSRSISRLTVGDRGLHVVRISGGVERCRLAAREHIPRPFRTTSDLPIPTEQSVSPPDLKFVWVGGWVGGWMWVWVWVGVGVGVGAVLGGGGGGGGGGGVGVGEGVGVGSDHGEGTGALAPYSGASSVDHHAHAPAAGEHLRGGDAERPNWSKERLLPYGGHGVHDPLHHHPSSSLSLLSLQVLAGP